jgi:acyl-coenzyme A synthetase/AMP-(fatty) acid ligase
MCGLDQQEFRAHPLDDLAGPGEQGQVGVSMESPETFAGYWNRPEADAQVIRDGWYFTLHPVVRDGEAETRVSFWGGELADHALSPSCRSPGGGHS